MENMLDSLKDSLENYRKNVSEHNKTIEELKDLYNKNMVSSMDYFKPEHVELHPVFVTRDINFILDFVNDCQDDVKEKVLDALKNPKKTVDKALFLTALKDTKLTYIILMTINSLEEEEGLVLAHSDHLDSICFFLSELTNLSTKEVKSQFEQ